MARVIREHRGIALLTALLIGTGIAASCFMDLGGGGGERTTAHSRPRVADLPG